MTFETGTNVWKSYDEWPPRKGVSDKKLYLRSGGKLSFEPPAEQDAFDSYISDPANPVPYRNRPITPTYPAPAWTTWLVQDQRFVEHRPDVLTWQTDPLTEDLRLPEISVPICSLQLRDRQRLDREADRVYPRGLPEDHEEDAERGADPVLNGYELMIADEILRGRYRNSLETPTPIVPNQVTEYRIDLHSNDHVFSRGTA